MKQRIIQDTLATSSGTNVMLRPNDELLGTVASYGAPITSGTISVP